MKKQLIILVFIFLSYVNLNAQNYIGIKRSMIELRFGSPDEKGTDYFMYFDKSEEGTNTYYFDEHNKCNAFIISRSAKYFKDYKNMLNQDFEQTPDNIYICKKKNFLAKVKKSNNDFKIIITKIEDRKSEINIAEVSNN